MAGQNMGTEPEKSAPIYGGPSNPVREPRKRPATGKGSIGDQALMDGVAMVVIAWLFLIFLTYSLRNHNV